MTDVSKSAGGPPSEAVGPKGIGGWLILPMLGNLLAPVLTLFDAYTSGVELTSSLSRGLFALTLIEMLFNLGLTAGWIVALVRLFQHKRSYPKLYVTLLAVTLIGLLIDVMVAVSFFDAPLEAGDVRQIARAAIVLAILGAYMFKSKRVKNTFVVD